MSNFHQFSNTSLLHYGLLDSCKPFPRYFRYFSPMFLLNAEVKSLTKSMHAHAYLEITLPLSRLSMTSSPTLPSSKAFCSETSNTSLEHRCKSYSADSDWLVDSIRDCNKKYWGCGFFLFQWWKSDNAFALHPNQKFSKKPGVLQEGRKCSVQNRFADDDFLQQGLINRSIYVIYLAHQLLHIYICVPITRMVPNFCRVFFTKPCVFI